jgi:hypothetical protein
LDLGADYSGWCILMASPDIYKDSLSLFPVMKQEQMEEKGQRAYDVIAGGPARPC